MRKNAGGTVKRVLCFGNPLVASDSIAQQAAKRLKIKGVKFVSCNSPEELLFYLDEEFLILDVAKGIRRVTVLNDASKLESAKFYSMHDFDLAFFLKLISKMRVQAGGTPANKKGKSKKRAGRSGSAGRNGNLGRIKIIAIPYGASFEAVKADVEKALR